MRRLAYTIILLGMPMLSSGQLTNLRSKVLPVLGHAQLLDTLTVVPSSVEVWALNGGERLPSAQYTLRGNAIWFDSVLVAKRTAAVRVRYRVLPFDLGRQLARLDSSMIFRDPGERLIGVPYNPFGDEEQPLLPSSGLDYNGSFTRGLSFGNNQSLVLNSQFNLQMAGTLGDVEVLAAITDNNIPLQPEGNTQQLREFDKIFVQFSKGGNRLIAGDYELGSPGSYFMQFNKKLQGATFSRQFRSADGQGTLNTRASLAVARGKFARNELAVQEGNQGPYRLQGAEGERFIIVLAGTEKVFLDGQLLNRGLDADYIIDYNAGHLSFTPRRFITKDSRIVVEFDYADQNYLRSLYALSNEYRRGKLRLYLHAFSEQDGRQPVDADLSETEQQVLRNAGDDELAAVVPSLDTLTQFSPFRVAYSLVDTVVAGQTFSGVLVYSTDPERALYTAAFSEVGSGNGNYIPDNQTNANGRVYRWVAPDLLTGRPSGNFEPVRRLTAPKQQQLFSAGAEYNISKNTVLRSEIALSNADRNRFSPLDDGDNAGVAATAGFRHLLALNNSEARPWQLETSVDYEFVQRQFRELSPYRPTEFTRDWNTGSGANDVSLGTRQTNEHIASAGLTLRSPAAGSLQYRFGGFLSDTLYTGVRHFAKYAFAKKGYDLWLQGDLLDTRSPGENTRFARPKGQLTLPLWRDSTNTRYWKTGLYVERENNRRYGLDAEGLKSDSLRATSFSYDLVRVFVEMPQAGDLQMKLHFQQRTDKAPDGSRFVRASRADELNMDGQWQQSRNTRLNWNFTWRQLSVADSARSKQEAATTYLGRLNYALHLLRGTVQSATNYELGSGQERKIAFTYIEVPAGEGTHQWIDRNDDQVVQVDEVEIAPFQDVANAVRVTSFTEELIRTNNVQLNQSLRLEPKAVWFNARGLRLMLSKFAAQSSLQIGRKVRVSEGVSAWNPFELNVVDSALVSTRAGTQHTLFFNRAHPKYDVQLGWSVNELKQVLTTGFESRRVREQFLKARWNLTQSLTLQPSLTGSLNEQGSELFENRRYLIKGIEFQTRLSYQPSSSFRATGSWRHKSADNRMEGAGESARTNELRLEAAYLQSSTTSLRSDFSAVWIAFAGEANSPAGFAFLNGLQNGRNFLWSLSLDRQLGRNLRMSLTYEGRKTGTADVVHVGRVQVGAVF